MAPEGSPSADDDTSPELTPPAAREPAPAPPAPTDPAALWLPGASSGGGGAGGTTVEDTDTVASEERPRAGRPGDGDRVPMPRSVL